MYHLEWIVWLGHVGDTSPSTGLQVLTLAHAAGAAAPALKWQLECKTPGGLWAVTTNVSAD